ncbi:hypothetical protein [Terasakiella pusilla]|uniref:hypothetical protein n=1 Tax=Terasakiella pusilla TaxID=64973 RepID=UPI003AA8D1E6
MMVKRSFVVLEEKEAPEKCYLVEVLYWRAFLRFPEYTFIEDKDARFHEDVLDSYTSPVPDDYGFTEEECQYAGISKDPAYEDLINDTGILRPEYYEEMLLIGPRNPDDSDLFKKKIQEELLEAKKHAAKIDKWDLEYEDYVDRFKSEIYLKLRHGDLIAYGTKLPSIDRDEVDEIIKDGEPYLSDFEVVPIPKEHWISSRIDWDEGSLNGREHAYIWLHVDTEEMLKLFPIEETGEARTVTKLSGIYIIEETASKKKTKRGRPPLPWDAFHVEVARMFKDGEMPEKKESAIAALQAWFVKQHHKPASRSVVGEKLKPYFDAMMK